MTRLPRLLLMTFIESFSTILVERGTYFYTSEILKFNERANLILAVVAGGFYVLAAASSHRCSVRLGEKPVVYIALIGKGICFAAMLIYPAAMVVCAASVGIFAASGLMWPVVESYVTAGRSPRDASRCVGWFNLSWSSAVPLTLGLQGALIAWWSPSVFVIGVVGCLVSVTLLLPLEKHPVHLADDHPARLPKAVLDDYKAQLTAARISMFVSFTFLFFLAPLMPEIFKKLDYGIAASTALSGLLDLMRVLMFVLLGATVAWHGKRSLLVISAIALPLSTAAVLFGNNTWLVIGGEIAFGLAAGMIYFAALYYAIMVANASVDAGGWHETMIGLGFTIGPAVALIGLSIARLRPESLDWIEPDIFGYTAVLIPIAIFGLIGSIYPLLVKPKPTGA